MCVAADELVKVLETLTKERDKRVEFFELSRQKQQSIIQNDIEQLSHVVRLEETMLHEITVLERARENAYSCLCAAMNVPPDTALSAVIERIDDIPMRDAVKSVREDLLAVAKKQQNMNINNKKLIDIKLQYTQNMVHAITQAATPTQQYNKNGYLGEETDKAYLVDRNV